MHKVVVVLRTACVAIGLAALLLNTENAFGTPVLTSITYTPSPIPLGGLVTFTANDNGGGGTPTYTWRYRGFVNASNFGNWVTASGTGKTINFYESYPDSTQIECTAVWPPDSSNPMGTTSTVSLLYSVPRADGDRVVAGLNTPTALGSTSKLLVEFQIVAGGMDAVDVSGSAEERIRRPTLSPPFDSGWTSSGPDFQLIGSLIDDYKTASYTLAAFDALPMNAVIDDFYQQNRIIGTNSCGTTIIMPLTEHHFQRIKSGYRMWSLIEL